MKIFVIRHGETTGDVENRYGGAYDDCLSPAGEQQVEGLAGELSDVGIEKIFASSLIRAEQTAIGLAEKVNCPIVLMDGLRERNQYGILSGVAKAEALREHPDLVEQLKDKDNTLPGAESYADAVARMEIAYKEILAGEDACYAVIWHGGGMRALFREFLKMGELEKIGDCAWVELEQDGAGEFVIRRAKRIEFSF